VNARLCIFTRVPVLGRVKSRLAAKLGEAAALRAHETLVEDTLRRLAAVPGVRAELWVDDHPNARVADWCREWQLALRQQQGADLGERMHRALADCLACGEWGIVVGTDCPPIDAAYVRRAVRALALHDLVLGPAEDGGFGLVGLSKPVPGLFDGVAWGGDQALRGTLANAIRLRLRICLLPAIWDVDEVDDWQRWERDTGGRPSPSPGDAPP
jgi:hypothetical protein